MTITQRMTGMAAAAMILLLAACSSPAKPLDTAALADAVTVTSGSIESTSIETGRDGTTTVLYVKPTITTEGLTADELDALLKVVYTESLGAVSTIEIRTVDANDDSVDLEPAASELGIHYLSHPNFISYSTEILKDAYGD